MRRRRRLVFFSLVLLLIAVVWVAMELRNGYETFLAPLRTLADNGAAAMKAPDGRVFVTEKTFGDQQLMAIIPALSHVSYFNSLDLHGSSVTDAGIGKLSTLDALQALDVSDTPVTVNGLLALQRLPNLHSITLSPGQLSEVDMQSLNAAFPRVIKSFRGEQPALLRTTGPSK